MDNSHHIAMDSSHHIAKDNSHHIPTPSGFSPTPSSPASTPGSAEHYDVFLCHRGETKGDLATVLYGHIKRAGMRPFLDKNEHMVGDIMRTLEIALSNSAVVVAIISPEFFTSEYCMRELDIADQKKITIFPVFYDVEIGSCGKLAKDASAEWKQPDDVKANWMKIAESLRKNAGIERSKFHDDNEALSGAIVDWLRDYFRKYPQSPTFQEILIRRLVLNLPTQRQSNFFPSWGFPVVVGILCVVILIYSAAALTMYTVNGQEALTWLVAYTYEPCSISAMGIATDAKGDTVVWIGDRVSVRTYYNQSMPKDNSTLGSNGMAFSPVDKTMWSINPDNRGGSRDAASAVQLFDDGVDIEQWHTAHAHKILYTCSRGLSHPGSISMSSIAIGAYMNTSDSILWAGCVVECVEEELVSHSEYFVQGWVVTATSVTALDPLKGHMHVIVEMRHSGGLGSTWKGSHTMWSASKDGEVIGWKPVDRWTHLTWVEMIRIKTPSPLTSFSVRRLPSPTSPHTDVPSSSLFMVWTGSEAGYLSACRCNVTGMRQWQSCKQIYVDNPVMSLALAPGMGAQEDPDNANAYKPYYDDDNYGRIQETATYNIQDVAKETKTVDDPVCEDTPYVLVVGLRNGTVNFYCSESRLLATFAAAGWEIFSMLVSTPSSVPNSPFYVWVGSKGGSLMHPGSVQGWKCEFLDLRLSASRTSYIWNKPRLCAVEAFRTATNTVVFIVILIVILLLLGHAFMEWINNMSPR